jgi:hypothetical protein
VFFIYFVAIKTLVWGLSAYLIYAQGISHFAIWYLFSPSYQHMLECVNEFSGARFKSVLDVHLFRHDSAKISAGSSLGLE